MNMQQPSAVTTPAPPAMPAPETVSLADAAHRLKPAYTAADALLEGQVGAEGALTQPISLRRPFVFYLGHLPAFARNTARRAGAPRLPPTHFDHLFERGIDPDVGDPAKCHKNPGAPAAWPAWRDVLRYRDRVRAEIAAAPLSRATLSLIFEHDLMHVETLYYMLAQAARPFTTGPATRSAPGLDAEVRPGRRSWLSVPAGDAVLGSRKSDSVSDGLGNCHFRWDNEFGLQTVAVPSFAIAELPVTVAEYLQFVNAGGYQRADCWSPPDWAWVQREGLSIPASWRRSGSDADAPLFVVSVDGPVPLSRAAAWPVSVSLAEARAFAKFANARLPTEAEWDRAAYGEQPVREDGVEEMVWGGTEATPGVHGNFGMHARCQVPVGSFPRGKSWIGAQDMVGNGWEMVDTVFEPFQGFEAMSLYPEYSADFFDGNHFVLKGASWATHASLVRRSFRNFYQPHYPFVFSKFRLVKSI